MPSPSSGQNAWEVIAESVKGATHERRALPNQDAVHWYRHENHPAFVILAVADGHGSVKCFRSDKGSRLAVEVAVDRLREFMTALPGQVNLVDIKRAICEQLPKEIVLEWCSAVASDLEANPLLVNETAAVKQEQGSTARDAVENKPIVAYGTTLLLLIAHPEFIAGMQLGDGDMIVVDADGKVSPMMEDDDRLLANETTSLSGENAWRDFRFSFLPIVDRPPVMLLVSTDGYSNSFNTQADFFKVGSDLVDLLRSEGVPYVRDNLRNWLNSASRQGSGDDVTTGLLYVPRPIERLTLEDENHKPVTPSHSSQVV
jgi:serine/threonine protein phosphatase PrpC